MARSQVADGTFRNRKMEYLKSKINELEINNKTKISEIFTEA
jgi:hypothetical protein